MVWSDTDVRVHISRLLDRLFGDEARLRVRIAERLVQDQADILFPQNETPQAATSRLIDLLARRTKSTLSDLRLILVQDLEFGTDQVDAVLGPLSLWLALREDGISADLNTLMAIPAVALFDAAGTLADGRSAHHVDAWRKARAPETTTKTRLPPVLYLVVHPSEGGYQLADAYFLSLGSPRHDLLREDSKARTSGVHMGSQQFSTVDALAMYARRQSQQVQELGLVDDVAKLVLVVQGVLDSELARLRSTVHGYGSLDEDFKAVCVWPVLNDLRANGRAMDGPIVPPKIGSAFEFWSPPHEKNVKRRPLGVWGEGWSTDPMCCVVCSHTHRAFTVLCNNKQAKKLIAKTHPNHREASLDDLFNAVRGAATLLWTDPRLLRRPA